MNTKGVLREPIEPAQGSPGPKKKVFWICWRCGVVYIKSITHSFPITFWLICDISIATNDRGISHSDHQRIFKID